MAVKVIPQLDFSGGMSPVTNPYVLRPNQVILLDNFLMDEHGSVRVRDGTLQQGAQKPSPSRPIVRIQDVPDTQGVYHKLAIDADLTGQSGDILYDRSTTPWTQLFQFATFQMIPDIQIFTALAILATTHSEVLHAFDGSTTKVLTGAPTAAQIANHLNYLWAGDTNPTTDFVNLKGPSSLQISAIDNPNSWPAAGQTWISPDDGQFIQALSLFTIAEAGISPTASIIVWKDFSGYEATGVLGTSTFGVQRIKSDMGCVAPRTPQFIAGFGLIRLSHRGFGLYDGVDDQLISEEMRPYLFGRDDILGIDWTQVRLSVATQIVNPPLYLCACPVAGSQGVLTRLFVYDLVRRAWSLAEFAHPLCSLSLILDAAQQPVVLGGDRSDGFVRRYFAGDPDDDGTAVTASLSVRPVTGGSPMVPIYCDSFAVQAFGFAPGSVLQVNFSFDGNTVPASVTMPTLTAVRPLTGYGTVPYGTSPYGSPTSTSQEATLWAYLLDGALTNAIFATISVTGPGKIRGVQWLVTPKPATRAVTMVTQ